MDLPDEIGRTGWEKLNARLGTPARDPVEALLARALAHDASGPSSLQLFVASMESTPVEIKRDLAEAGAEVRVMTVHGAKGLQAPIVILPDTTAKPKLYQRGDTVRGRRIDLVAAQGHGCRGGRAGALAGPGQGA